jgi:hypothetical protein
MSDPKRWMESEDEAAASLVSALAMLEPSKEVRDRILANLALSLPSNAPPAPDGAASATSASVTLKAIAVAGTLLVGGAAVWLFTRAPAPPIEDASTPPVPTVAPRPEAPPPSENAPLPSMVAIPGSAAPPVRSAKRVVAAPPPSAAPSASTAQPSRLDLLREEAEGVRKVRQMLREKNAAAALTELDRLAGRMPNGPLEEEREVLTIEALSMSGRTEAAKRRAERFLFERPQSVHASRVRAFTSPER